MKKTLFVLVAAMLVFATLLTGCEVKEKDPVSEEVVNSDLLAYTENLEATLEEFVAKTELDDEVLATANGLPVSAATVRYTTMALKGPSFEETGIEDPDAEAEKFYKETAVLLEYAGKNNVQLTETDVTTIKANVTGMQLQLGDEYNKTFAESPFTEFFYFFQTSLLQTLYSRIYEDSIADHDSEMSKKALEDTLKTFEEGEYVRAKHILIQFPAGEGENGELTDEQKQTTLDKANEVLAKVDAMSDISEFDTLIKEYNEDPGMESNPNGYYFTKGQMVLPFEESAYSLSEGETSGLVETDYGYHILLKLPLNDEAIYDSEVYANSFDTALYDDIMAGIDNIVVEYAENHDARVEEFLKEYDELIALAEAEASSADLAE